MMQTEALPALLLFGFIGTLMVAKRSTEIQTINAMMRAHIDFVIWVHENPHTYIGLSVTAKELLTELIISYDMFQKVFPFVENEGRREYLMSLYDDIPPKPFKPNTTKETEPLQNGVVFLVKYVTLW